MQRFWMVYRVGDRAPNVKHGTLEKAIHEAKRLYKMEAATYLVLECVGYFDKPKPPEPEFIQTTTEGE